MGREEGWWLETGAYQYLNVLSEKRWREFGQRGQKKEWYLIGKTEKRVPREGVVASVTYHWLNDKNENWKYCWPDFCAPLGLATLEVEGWGDDLFGGTWDTVWNSSAFFGEYMQKTS